MDPSSLIFVVIVAIWAAYLLGHWVRRRDQLATARSIDRFSQAMRVLERRTPVAVPASARTRGHVVASVTGPASRSTAPAPAAPVASPSDARQATRPGSSRPTSPRPKTAPARTTSSRAAATAARSGSSTPSGPAAPSRPGRGVRVRAVQVRAVQVRALALLSLLVLAPLGWLLVGVTTLPWWVAAVLTLALVGQVAALRRAAARRRELARRRARIERRAGSQARRQSTREVVDGVLSARRDDGEGAGSVDAAATEPETVAVEPAVVTAGWSPVPVPPPTYTLKPKAPKVVVRPVAQTPPSAAPPPEVEAPHETAASAPAPAFDLDEILERRIASGG